MEQIPSQDSGAQFQNKFLSDPGFKDLSLSTINKDNSNETEKDLYLNIYNNLKFLTLPKHFTFQTIITNKKIILVSSFLFSEHLQMVILYKQFMLHQNLSIEIIIYGIKYSTIHITSIEELAELILYTDQKSVCEGYSNILFSSTSRSPYKKVLFGKVRHTKCSILFDNSRTENKLCLFCERIKINEHQKCFRKSDSRLAKVTQKKKYIWQSVH